MDRAGVGGRSLGAKPTAFLDTSVLLRHLLQDDPIRSPRATAYLHRIELGEIVVQIANTVVFEAVFVLERRMRRPKAEIRDSVLPILELPGIVLAGKARLREAFDHYVRLNIPFADAYHAVTARHAGLSQIVAFDDHFNRVPGLTRIEP